MRTFATRLSASLEDRLGVSVVGKPVGLAMILWAMRSLMRRGCIMEIVMVMRLS